MSRQRHVPVRSCMGCGAREAKSRLLRVVRESSGELRVDAALRKGGRGGYLHRSAACWRLFVTRKGRIRSFRAVVDRERRGALVESLQRSVDQRGAI